jgi:hypothetical protein
MRSEQNSYQHLGAFSFAKVNTDIEERQLIIRQLIVGMALF